MSNTREPPSIVHCIRCGAELPFEVIMVALFTGSELLCRECEAKGNPANTKGRV